MVWLYENVLCFSRGFSSCCVVHTSGRGLNFRLGWIWMSVLKGPDNNHRPNSDCFIILKTNVVAYNFFIIPQSKKFRGA